MTINKTYRAATWVNRGDAVDAVSWPDITVVIHEDGTAESADGWRGQVPVTTNLNEVATELARQWAAATFADQGAGEEAELEVILEDPDSEAILGFGSVPITGSLLRIAFWDVLAGRKRESDKEEQTTMSKTYKARVDTHKHGDPVVVPWPDTTIVIHEDGTAESDDGWRGQVSVTADLNQVAAELARQWVADTYADQGAEEEELELDVTLEDPDSGLLLGCGSAPILGPPW